MANYYCKFCDDPLDSAHNCADYLKTCVDCAETFHESEMDGYQCQTCSTLDELEAIANEN